MDELGRMSTGPQQRPPKASIIIKTNSCLAGGAFNPILTITFAENKIGYSSECYQ
jgi:hypothetical protein